VRLKHFDRPLIPLLSFWSGRRPDVGFSIFTSTDDVSAAICESATDLAAVVFMASKLHLKALVFQVVYPQPRIVARD
jgi:hypothetical protein